MLKINYEGTKYSIKNKLTELLIKDYEKIASILNREDLILLDRYTEIFVYLGIPRDVAEDIDSYYFIECIQKFNLITNEPLNILQSIDINGTSYVAYENEFKLSTKERSLIEKYTESNKDSWIANAMAVIYKNPEIDSSLKYDKAHLEYKAQLIRDNITADKCIPIIDFLSKRAIKEYELLNK